jgi:hypothetical protein
MENNIILYSNEHEKVSINVTFLNDTFWLPQKEIAELFGCSTDNVSLHLKNIFNSGELDQNSVTEEFSATAEYEQFRIEQDKKYISDLDRALEKAKSKK